MSAEVPRSNGSAQFLFTASPNSPLIGGFRINQDGSLAPIAGSPFLSATRTLAIASLDGALLIADENGITAFTVDTESGSIRRAGSLKVGVISGLRSNPTDSRVLAFSPTGVFALAVHEGRLQTEPVSVTGEALQAEAPQQAVLDAGGKFMYLLQASRANLLAFRVEGDRLHTSSIAEYPVPLGSNSLVLIKR